MHWSCAVEILVFLVLMPSETSSSSIKLHNKNCTNVDVRNNVSNLEKIANCIVIEGYLQIVLIENATKQDFIGRSYPMLREVTGFMIFFRVGGLQSIGKLFPNLSVIRGSTLFLDYGLVVHKMPNLEEISLDKLRILRGGVAATKNPVLCFLETVNWTKVAISEVNFLILPGADESECPKCKSCSNCWSSEKCQEEPKADECHEECIGGCTGPGPGDCEICRNLLHNGICVKSCPEGSFERKGQDCITAETCENSRNRLDQGEKWFTWNQTCTQSCPPGMIRGKVEPCEPCPGICPVECESTYVNSLSAAQKLKGCTHIKGSLVISYTTGKPEVVAKELEENLGSIEEIRGSLTISRSFPLQNLNFLRNLTIIKGKHRPAESHAKYSFIVKDNENLVKLWDWDKKPRGKHLEIQEGQIFFHYNSKLCIQHIEELIAIAQVTLPSGMKETNGDVLMCQNASLQVQVTQTSFDRFTLTINEPKQPSFLTNSPPRYAVYYAEGERLESSLLFDSSPCSDKEWKIIDSIEEVEANRTRLLITNLKPYTNYTYLVRKYTFDPSEGVARSPLQYVRTLSSTPGVPVNVQAIANSSSEVTISWSPPVQPNGEVEYYVVEGVLQEDDEEFILSGRNFCLSKMLPPRPATTASPNRRKSDVTAEVESAFDLPLSSLISSLPHDITESSQTCDADTTSANDLVFRHPVKGQNFHVVSGLRPFSSYLVYVSACNTASLLCKCSRQSVTVVRTKAVDSADKIDESSISLQVNERNASLSWSSPLSPNGFVVSYDIELRRIEIGNHKPLVECEPALVGRGRMVNVTLGPYEPGHYSLRVRAVSLFREGPFSSPRQFHIAAPISHGPIIIFLILAGSVLVVGLISVYYYRYYLIKKHKVLVATVNPEYGTEAELSALNKVYTEDEWELPREYVIIGNKLKDGNFGMVCEGVLNPEGRRVAIKTCKESFGERESVEFLAEAAIMKEFKGAPHIVSLIGVVSRGKPPLVVMELMALGDLKTFLRQTREYSPQFPSPDALKIIMMAAQISDGMAFLEAKKFVHRDLAARNCMVSENLTVKIGDFGMTRDIYETDYYRKGSKGLLPIRWMSPESLNDGVFTTHSDVWSYGVVLWEMVNQAAQPYQGMTNEQVLQYVVQGNKLEPPNVCPAALKPIMTKCWKWKPKLRPSFFTILSDLDPFLDDDFRRSSFYHSPDSEDARNQLAQSLLESKAQTLQAEQLLLSTTSNEELSAQSVDTSSLLD